MIVITINYNYKTLVQTELLLAPHFVSRDKLFHLQNKRVLIVDAILWLQNVFSLQRELRQDCDNVKGSQSWNHFETKGFIVPHSLSVKIYSGPEKGVTPLCVHAMHCHLYLVIITVSAL